MRDSDIVRLAGLLRGNGNAGPKQLNHGHYLNEQFLPEFDPAMKVMSASEWINKINDCGLVYEWDDKVKLYLSGCRLRGNAKLWHDGLTHTFLNWEVFSHELIKQFPGEESFGQLFIEAAEYKSKPGQDLQEYCFSKLQKINKLKLSMNQDQVVDLIAHGIHDESIQTTILTARLSTVSDLNQRLGVFRAKTKSLETHKNTKETKDHNGSKYFKQSSFKKPGERDSKSRKEMVCHGCKKPGHFRRDCPERGEEKVSDARTNNKSVMKCTYCRAMGHVEAKCYKKQAAEAAGGKK